MPSGLGYENVTIANQVCTTIGSVQGSATVDGNAYLAASYGYSYSNIWRVSAYHLTYHKGSTNNALRQNYGITVAFGVAFIAGLLFFTEWNTTSSSETSSMRFKRGTTTPPLTQDPIDEEKGAISSEKTASAHDDIEEVPLGTPSMKDVFTWQHLEYTVPVGGGQMRRLLDDVSGYVAPGKLTALMGESGAGKVRYLVECSPTNVLIGLHGNILDNVAQRPRPASDVRNSDR